jgi:predicted Ser/Thr protein kinase
LPDAWQIVTSRHTIAACTVHAWLLLRSGLLLGVGSFGRVYKGAWRGMEVAVKVLHHDSNTAAAVANEVDLVMSFK